MLSRAQCNTESVEMADYSNPLTNLKPLNLQDLSDLPNSVALQSADRPWAGLQNLGDPLGSAG